MGANAEGDSRVGGTWQAVAVRFGGASVNVTSAMRGRQLTWDVGRLPIRDQIPPRNNHLFFPINIARNTPAAESCVYYVWFGFEIQRASFLLAHACDGGEQIRPSTARIPRFHLAQRGIVKTTSD